MSDPVGAALEGFPPIETNPVDESSDDPADEPVEEPAAGDGDGAVGSVGTGIPAIGVGSTCARRMVSGSVETTIRLGAPGTAAGDWADIAE